MRVRALILPVIAAAAFLAAACTAAPTTTTPTDNGVSALSADEILAKAKTALAGAKSFHLKGSGVESGVTTSMDLVYAGANAKGTVDLGGGASVEAIRIGTDIYAKATDGFWAMMQLPAEVSALAKGKWAKVPPALGVFVPTPDKLLAPTGAITKGATTTVNGVDVIELKDTEGSLYIATKGDPLPIKLKSGEAGFDFSEYNAAVTIEAPPAAETVDLVAALSGS